MIQVQDYINYWKELFPDLSGLDDIQEVFEKSSQKVLIDETEKMISAISQNKITNKQYGELIFYNSYKDKPELEKYHEMIGLTGAFYNFYKPYINYLLKMIIENDKLERLIVDNDELIIDITKSLLHRITPIAGRCLIHDTEIAKSRKLLKGTDSKERFIYYNKILLKDDNHIESIFNVYEELGELLRNTTEKFTMFALELLENVYRDRCDIKDEFGIDLDKTSISKIDFGSGDSHEGGKAVATVSFSDNKKLMYKPRNLEVEVNLNKMIEWFNSINIGIDDYLDLKTTKILTKTNYGYAEFIEYASCSNDDEVRNYYIRTGQWLAILNSLNAVDLHYENVIASGEHPVIVDFETLLHPNDNIDQKEDDPENIVIYKLNQSVKRLGLLPFLIGTEEESSIDLSGLGSNDNKKAPFKSFKLSDTESEDISIKYDYFDVDSGSNKPSIMMQEVNSKDYVEEILSGFRVAYELILKNKQIVLDKVEELFKQVNVRVLLRSTVHYTTLINMSYNPGLMMDELSRKVLFSRLAVNCDYDKKITQFEHGCLCEGDIPVFKINTSSRDLILGNNILKNYELQTPLEQTLQKIESMNAADMRFQEKLINISYINKKQIYELDRTYLDLKKFKYCNDEEYAQSHLELAKSIADYLIDQSIVYGPNQEFRTWIGSNFSEDDKGYSLIGHIGSDLYAGETGIALFLTYCGVVFKDEKYMDFAWEAVQNSIVQLKSKDYGYPYTIGGFSGLAGRLYPIIKLASLTDKYDVDPIIEEYLDLFDGCIDGDNLYDVVSGTSGLLMVLLSLYQSTKTPAIFKKTEELIEKCVKHIVEKISDIDDEQMTWVLSIEREAKSYTGFGHGNAGILASLVRYRKIFDTDKYDELIKKVNHFESKMYNEGLRNWYKDSDKNTVSFGWCHGVTGILLNKLLMYKFGYQNDLNDATYYTALETTIESSFGNNPSLCHGDLGNLEILMLAAKLSNDVQLEKLCNNGFDWVVKNVIEERWKGKSYRGIEVLGLMVGLAGFGYSILKNDNFSAIPSVLWLE